MRDQLNHPPQHQNERQKMFSHLGPFVKAQFKYTSGFCLVCYISHWDFAPSNEKAIMTYSSRAIAVRIHEQIDRAWNREYVKFLDLNGREPRPIDKQSFTLISAFFVLSWGMATWQGLSQMIPAIAIAAIVSFASLRFNGFQRAYQQYRQRRAELDRT